MLAKTPLRDLMTMWLELQDPDEHYPWDNPFHCACAQFARTVSNERAEGWYRQAMRQQRFTGEWAQLNEIARGEIIRGNELNPSEWTFGKMLQRMKETAPC
jgi:hypothetical protein